MSVDSSVRVLEGMKFGINDHCLENATGQLHSPIKSQNLIHPKIHIRRSRFVLLASSTFKCEDRSSKIEDRSSLKVRQKKRFVITCPKSKFRRVLCKTGTLQNGRQAAQGGCPPLFFWIFRAALSRSPSACNTEPDCALQNILQNFRIPSLKMSPNAKSTSLDKGSHESKGSSHLLL